MQGRRGKGTPRTSLPPFLALLFYHVYIFRVFFTSRLTYAVALGRQVMWKIEVFLLSRQKNYFRRFFCRHAVYCILQNTRFVQLSGENSAETRPQLRLPNSWFI